MRQMTSRDALTNYMISALETQKLIFPNLKLCIGDAFEKDHWRDLFTLLKLPRDVKLETLKFYHFLEAE